MRRTSKFSFPVPGRKESPKFSPEPEYPRPRAQNLSKAQRILGTAGNLNIDSPIRDQDGSWRSRSALSPKRPNSSGMSIAISEEDDDIYASNAESWDNDEAIHPPRRLRGKASSTLLGYSYKGEGDNSGGVSPIGRGIREEKSSSTLRSYYDRAKTPLAVSQQTSASSARDHALRKGHPPVVPLLERNPLFPADYSEHNAAENGSGYFHGQNDHAAKKKPSRLNIGRLFHKKSKDGSLLSPEDRMRPPSMLPGQSDGGSRKLTKVPSRPKQKSAMATSPVNQLREEKSVQFMSKEDSQAQDLYEHYENRAYQNPAPSASPSSAPPPRPHNSAAKTSKQNHHQTNGVSHHDLRSPPAHDSPSSTRNCHVPHHDAEFVPAPRPPWDSASTYSDSSKATRTSRKSVFSSSNLQQHSILSLSSSDSDSDPDSQDLRDRDLAKFPRPSTSHPSSLHNRASQNGGRTAHQRKRSSTVNSPASTATSQNDKYLTIPLSIPLPHPVSPRISGPWAPAPLPVDAQSMHSAHSGRLSRQSTLRSNSRRGQSPSSASGRSIDAQTPGATPRSSRLMAVTPQEQALLSALRNKRARMRDEIIAEHETVAHEVSPGPRAKPSRRQQQQRPPSPPSTGGTRGPRGHGGGGGGDVRASYGSATTTRGQQRILLYLDRPMGAGPQGFDAAEPSPDLSDFLSFGSDEDEESTPRSSWLPAAVAEEEEEVGRPDSGMEGMGMGMVASGRMSRSQARLSAVGKNFGGQTSRQLHEVKVLGTERDEEEEGVWGM